MKLTKTKLPVKVIVILGLCVLALFGISGCELKDDRPEEQMKSDYIAEGSAECIMETNDYQTSYTVFVKVGMDENGNITSVIDNGTSPDTRSRGKYKNATKIFKSMVGSNADTLSDIDAISGATISSEAIIEATRNAIENLQTK